MTIRSLIKFVLLLLLLLSCCIPSNDVTSPIITAVDKASPTPLPFQTKLTPVHQGTENTGELPLESAKPTLSITASENQTLDVFTLSCQGISSTSIERSSILGNLLATDENGFFVLELKTGIKIRVLQDAPIASMRNVFISPNGEYITYTVYQNATGEIWLVVEPVSKLLKNDASKQIEWGKGTDFQLEGWFTNETLLVTRKNNPTSFFSTLVINPFNKEEKEYILEDLPNYKYFKSGGVGLYHFSNSNLMPDPSLRMVVYPEWLNGQDYISLWDLETRKTLSRIEDQYAYTGNPLWAQDGSNFLMVASTIHSDTKTIFDWFKVSRDGTIEQITHFADMFEYNTISNASRSQDGRYLSFKMKTSRASEEKVRFYVLDMQTDQLVLFCVDAPDTPSSITEKQPIWSPDSRYLVISNTDESNHGSVLLVDLGKKQGYEISKDVNVRGWMIDP